MFLKIVENLAGIELAEKSGADARGPAPDWYIERAEWYGDGDAGIRAYLKVKER
jgi:hypothetical protein